MKINDVEDEKIAEYLTFNFRQMQKTNFNQEIQKTGIFRIREGEDFGLKSPVSEFSKDLGSFSFVGKDSLPEMHKRALLEISKEKSRDASVTSSIRSASSQVKSKTPLSIKTSPSSFTPKQSSVLSPSAVVHSPSRFSANKQAMVTTDSSWNILVANNLFCLMLEKPVNEVINMNITSFFSEPYNEKQKIFLEEKMNKTLGGGGEPNDVWICGKIVRPN
jgi:PAS domain-containing protein